MRTIQGGASHEGVRLLEGEEAQLAMRLPESELDALLGLQEEPLRLGEHLVMVGEPTVQPVRPSPNLESDLVYADGDHVPNGLNAGNLGGYIGKQLGAEFGHRDFGIRVGEHRTFHVDSHLQHGNAVTLRGLSDEESLWVQCHGIGQKQSWGCGTFWHMND